MAQGLACPAASMPISPASTWSASAKSDFYVLEDNVRTPSGVSYVLENREVMMRLFPELFSAMSVLPVEQLPEELLADLARGLAARRRRPNVVLLTPGHLQQRLFRACLPRRADGHRAGRGPDCSSTTATSICARPRDRSASTCIYRRRRRRLPRPAGLPARFRARRAGPAGRLSRRAASRSSTRSAPAWPTTSRPTPTCRR